MLTVQAFLQKHHIEDNVLAVGVSGGADSMALALMLQEQLAVFGRRIVALTVDHHLRPNSSQEAQYVAEVMQKFGIEHHILEWFGAKPQANVEASAREARYGLLKDWCEAHQIRCLFVAHHSQDQAETFLLRLRRGSGLEGLCAMRELSKWQGLKILRPLLSWRPQELQAYLQTKNVAWITDESNSDKRFERNKMRAFLPLLQQKSGISVEKICTATRCLQSAEDYIETQVEAIMESSVHCYGRHVFYFRFSDFLSWHAEIQFRILARLSRQKYMPRAERVLRLVSRMRRLPFTSATLGQKEFILAGQTVWVVPEIRQKTHFKAKDWADFKAQNSDYQKIKLPYQVRHTLMMEAKGDL